MPPESHHRPLAGLATRMLVLACGFWGVSFPVAKALEHVQRLAVPEGDSWLLAAATLIARFGAAAVVVAGLMLLRRGGWKFTGPEVWQGLGLGLFGGVGMLFQFDGLAHTEASTSAFLTQGTVIFVPLVQAMIQHRFPARRELLCCSLALVGVAIISGMDWQRLHLGRGELETLIAALFFTGQILWIERPGFQQNDSLRVSFVMFSVVALVSLSQAWSGSSALGAMTRSIATPEAWLFLATLIGPCTLLSYIWMNRWQRHVSATTAGLIYSMEPVFTLGFTFFLPGWFSSWAGIIYTNESLHRNMLIGGSLILMANLFMQWPVRRGESPTLLNEHGV